MAQKRTTIVCERCMRNTVILWNDAFQNITDYKACPLCGSKLISHITKGEEHDIS